MGYPPQIPRQLVSYAVWREYITTNGLWKWSVCGDTRITAQHFTGLLGPPASKLHSRLKYAVFFLLKRVSVILVSLVINY